MYKPLYRSRPEHRVSYGDLACKVGADLGLPPDDEQRWILDAIYAEQATALPTSFEVAVIGPRQNIKTSTFGIAAIADLFVFGVERHIWSSHLLDTSKSTFGDFKTWIDRTPEYAHQVRYYEGHQDLAIIHNETGRIIEFRSRTGKASRGVTGVNRVTLDEALFLEKKHVDAVYPTMILDPSAQVRLGSSAGKLFSVELRKIRDKGRAGGDGRMAYVEYGANRRACGQRRCLHAPGTPGCALDDRDLWWQANPAMWSGRLLEEALENMRNSTMTPEGFMVEFLTWWEDPVSAGGALAHDAWLTLGDPGADRGKEPPVFGLHLTPDRDVWIAVAWIREDGNAHVMLANQGTPVPAHEAVAQCQRLQARWGGQVATIALTEDLERAGVEVLKVSGEDFAAACGSLEDRIQASTIRHGNQPALNDGVQAASWGRSRLTGERPLALNVEAAAVVGPVAAAVRALHGLAGNEPFFAAWR